MGSEESRTYEHSCAKAWLRYFGNKIYIKGQEYMHCSDEVYEKFKPYSLKTYLTVGDDIVEDEDISTIQYITYGDLMERFGYAIYSYRAKKKWYHGQQKVYTIEKLNKTNEENLFNYNSFTARHNKQGMFKIEWNPSEKWIRGIGKGFTNNDSKKPTQNHTQKIYYDEKKESPNKILSKRDSYADVTEDLFSEWLSKPLTHSQKVRIKELPVMITDDGKLLCIPQDENLVPKILIVGKSGKGKSFAMNSLLGRVVYCFKDRVGLLNDSLDQFYDLMLENDSTEMSYTLERIGNKPKNLPVINLYMSGPNITIKYAKELISYRLVVSMKEFLTAYGFWTKNIPTWSLDKPQSYLTKDVINHIHKSRTIKDLKEKLYECIDMEDKKSKSSMIYKWLGKFENIFRDEFTDNLFMHEPTTSPYWTLVRRDGKKIVSHPFLVCMEAGLVPVVNNFMVKTKPVAKKQMVSLIYKITEHQMNQGKDKRQMWVFVDELRDFLGRKGDELYEALDYLFTQGRFLRLGFCGNVQEYSKLSKGMKSNSTHLIIFEMQTDDERKAIGKDYSLTKSQLQEMGVLKKFQCLFTTKEKIVIYDIEGRRQVKEGGLYRGKILPPLSTHKAR